MAAHALRQDARVVAVLGVATLVLFVVSFATAFAGVYFATPFPDPAHTARFHNGRLYVTPLLMWIHVLSGLGWMVLLPITGLLVRVLCRRHKLQGRNIVLFWRRRPEQVLFWTLLRRGESRNQPENHDVRSPQ